MDTDLTLNVGAKGADEAAAKIKSVSDNLSEGGKQTSGFADKLQKASLALAGVGIGLTAYSKSATNSYIDYVKQTSSIARVTGDTVTETSRLQAVFERSGVQADQTSQVFGAFSKQISATNDAAKDAAANQDDYANKIKAAQIKIQDLTADTAKNGDATGKNANEIEHQNIVIDDLKKKATEAQTPLQKLGVATQDAAGKTRPFSDILLDVADKFKTMPNGPEKTTLAMQLFGKSGKTLLPILNKGSDGIKDLEDQADKLGLTLSGKNVDAVAKYSEAHKKVAEAQKAFTLQVGMQALPMWQKVADAQTKATQVFQGLPGPIKDAVASVAAFGGPIATAAGGIVGFASNASSIDFSKLGKGFLAPAKGAIAVAKGTASATKWLTLNTIELAKNGAMAVWTAVKWVATNVAMLAVRGATLAWTAAQWLLNAALNANPIGLIIIALVALAAGIVLLWTHSQTFRDIVTGAFNAVWGAIQAVWNWITQNWPLLLAILTGPIGWAVLLIVSNWETIKAAFAAAWQFIVGVWSAVAGFFAGVWQGIVTAFSAVVGWFGSIFSSAWQAVMNVFAGVGGFFVGVWNTITGIFGKIGSAISDAVSGAIKGAINGILNGASKIINGFIDTINGAVNIINKLPGVNIPKIGRLNVPQLADGGIIQPRPGGTLVNVAEAGKAEAVVPLDKMGQMGATNNFYGSITLNGEAAVDRFFERLNRTQQLASIGVPV